MKTRQQSGKKKVEIDLFELYFWIKNNYFISIVNELYKILADSTLQTIKSVISLSIQKSSRYQLKS